MLASQLQSFQSANSVPTSAADWLGGALEAKEAELRAATEALENMEDDASRLTQSLESANARHEGLEQDKHRLRLQQDKLRHETAAQVRCHLPSLAVCSRRESVNVNDAGLESATGDRRDAAAASTRQAQRRPTRWPGQYHGFPSISRA